ncbi:universal stress protein [Streptosporangium sandarakinum]|uniref:universal stress protein n=1 Tax=Streptosporangium sandarakinum TaxID=1260955 RepID=UPI0037AF0226
MTGLIVVGADGSASATAAVEWAALDAARTGAALRVVHVREPWAAAFPPAGTGLSEDVRTRYCQDVLDAAVGRARECAPEVEVTGAVVAGAVVERLRDEAERADEVVIGNRGAGGFAELLLGSVGLGLAGHAPGPVVVVRAPARTAHGTVVVGFDGSEHSEAALGHAFAQARLRGARLRVVHGWRAPVIPSHTFDYASLLEDSFQEEVRTARQRLEPWREKYADVEVAESAVLTHPVPLLTEESRDADLVVVGARGLGGFGSAVLGSVSHGVLHHAHCPVAVVRPRP